VKRLDKLFKVGDRVAAALYINGKKSTGEIVCIIKYKSLPYRVLFDIFDSYHPNYYMWMNECELSQLTTLCA
jgi:mRNA-degrading endonuclease RelE of RelBE toxin-antitoxin system